MKLTNQEIADRALKRIEAILSEIEEVDRATGGRYRQASDNEALRIVERIERKLRVVK